MFLIEGNISKSKFDTTFFFKNIFHQKKGKNFQKTKSLPQD
jgi:hypothetical protein